MTFINISHSWCKRRFGYILIVGQRVENHRCDETMAFFPFSLREYKRKKMSSSFPCPPDYNDAFVESIKKQKDKKKYFFENDVCCCFDGGGGNVGRGVVDGDSLLEG